MAAAPRVCPPLHPMPRGVTWQGREETNDRQRAGADTMMRATVPPPLESLAKLHVEGPFGTGKTGMALQRLAWLQRTFPDQGLTTTVLVPSSYALQEYRLRLVRRAPRVSNPCRILTFDRLMREAVSLAWPLIAPHLAYEKLEGEPVFLNLETSQYLLAHWVDGMVAEGKFEAVLQHSHFSPNRLMSQILDNQVKAALYRYSLEDAYQRLVAALPPTGKFHGGILNAYRSAFVVSRRFRRHCLRFGLVDRSLMYELFYRILDDAALFEALVVKPCRHLVVDYCEEQDFACHAMLRQLIPRTESCLCLADQDGGFRSFLGAYPEGVERIARLCDVRIELSPAPDSGRRRFERRLDSALHQHYAPPAPTAEFTHALTVHRASPMDESPGQASAILDLGVRDYHPEILEWTADSILDLVHRGGVAPNQIVVLAPNVNNVLRFSMENALSRRGLPFYSHRPSRQLEDEPAARALLSLACQAHPQWNLKPDPMDLRVILLMVLADLEGWRAPVIAQEWHNAHRQYQDLPDHLQEQMQSRHGIRYDALRTWIMEYRQEQVATPLDVFFARVHDEVLGRTGFGFRIDANSARITRQLIRSARTFREMVEGFGIGLPEGDTLGSAYVQFVRSGLIGGLYLPPEGPPAEAIVLSPVSTFLMQNRMVDHQFWLEVNHPAWRMRLHQPMTQPYVLSPERAAAAVWTDLEEEKLGYVLLRRTMMGLARRTRRMIHLGISAMDEAGYSHMGPLLNVVNQMLMREIGGA